MFPIKTKHLGQCDYEPIFHKMRDFTLQRTAETPNEIWFLEHSPVFTQGMAGKAEHILNPGNIPIVQTDRGGQITYHGPGQLVAYVLYDLRRGKIGVKKFVETLERAVIETLATYKITANIDPNAPGVYINHAKICSIGLRIRNGSSYHGIALNVTNDLEPFRRINPCGFKNLKMTRVLDFIPDITIDAVSATLEKHLIKSLP
jgi:lipoyl(octanoyl) transferase